MTSRAKQLTTAAGVLVIFAAGVLLGLKFAKPSLHRANLAVDKNLTTTERGEAKPNPNGKNRSVDSQNTPKKPSDPALELALKNIRDARILPQGEKMTPLLKALERTTELPLSKELLDEFRSLVNEGDIESSHYIMSLMEQREEKASVDFLLQSTSHQDPDISDRALFALEAVAGNVFPDRAAAEKWAATWKPDPERAKLFSPTHGSDDDNKSDPTRLPGPRGLPQKESVQEGTQEKNSPTQ